MSKKPKLTPRQREVLGCFTGCESLGEFGLFMAQIKEGEIEELVSSGCLEDTSIRRVGITDAGRKALEEN